jgi:hypothetical protein
MKPRVMLLLAALAAMLSLVEPAFAQRNLTIAAAPASEQRVALIIGNAAYKDAPLRNPVNDATDIARALRELGFKTTLKTNVGQRQMKDAIREFGSELARGGVGLFYFAGHGLQYKGRNFLVPIGAAIEREAHIEDETVDAAFVLAHMEEARNRVNLVILDACRNNPYTRGMRSVSRGLAQMDATQGTLVAFATAPGAVALDGDGRNGVYTKHLLRQVRQPGVPVELMFKRVRDGVIEETREKQTPWEASSLRGADFYFRPGAAAASLAAGALAADPAAVELATFAKPPQLVQLRLANIDDIGRAFVNDQQVSEIICSENTCTNDTGWIDVTKKIRPGMNRIRFNLENGKYGGWKYRFQLSAGQQKYDTGIVSRDECPCNAPVLTLWIEVLVSNDGDIESVSQPHITYFRPARP